MRRSEAPPEFRRARVQIGRVAQGLTPFAAGCGLAATAQVVPQLLGGAEAPLLWAGSSAALGAGASVVAVALGCTPAAAGLLCAVGCAITSVGVGAVLVVPVDVVEVVAFAVGALLACAAMLRRRVGTLGAVAALGAVGLVGSVAGAGAWSVDEPGSPSDPRMVAGNGIVVAVDTHAFLIQQGVVILRGDGRTAIADFLDSPDPTAPFVRTPAGDRTTVHESYVWRMQLGARDADRSLKRTEMPDHFFNWWTHSGKGLIAGPSSATWAEQQYAQAVAAWRAGDRATAMYRLGAATHLVDDACAPPHESSFVPNHRAYENWVLAHQDSLAVTSGGIYQRDFRATTGHGGPAWSSAHTRGWVDECSHRAAELVLNTAQPPPDDPADASAYAHTELHFRDTQRLTAGYLAFFFDHVGGP